MSGYDILLVVILIVFCGWASYTDLKEKKIKNICSMGLIYAGILAQVMLFLLGETKIGNMLSVFIMGGIIAFGMYWLGILAPGDAKLYWGVAMILPPSIWGRNLAGFPYPALIIFINIFIVYFVYSLVTTCVRYFSSHRSFALTKALPAVKQAVKQLPGGMWSLLQFVLIIFGVQFFAYQSRIPFNLWHLVAAIFLYQLLKHALESHANKHISNLVYLALFVAILMDPVLLGAFWKRVLVFAVAYQLVLPVVRTYVLDLDMSCLSQVIRVQDLQSGMNPAEKIVKVQTDEGVRYKKEQALVSDLHNENLVVSPTPEGLSDEKVQELKALADAGVFKGFDDSLAIQRAIHFAPIILAGTLLTVLCGGPFYGIIT